MSIYPVPAVELRLKTVYTCELQIVCWVDIFKANLQPAKYSSSIQQLSHKYSKMYLSIITKYFVKKQLLSTSILRLEVPVLLSSRPGLGLEDPRGHHLEVLALNGQVVTVKLGELTVIRCLKMLYMKNYCSKISTCLNNMQHGTCKHCKTRV